MKRKLIELNQLTAELLPPGWSCDGKVLERWFEFKEFRDALNFVNRVGELAEAMDHHPEIDIRYRRVRLELMTHSAGGITALDLEFAKNFH
jgi:4a-hydroxytetrahydrobiopterin dehydratase